MTQERLGDKHGPRVVADNGHCSLCGGTHFGTGPYHCPFECDQCKVNTNECAEAGCPRNARWKAEQEAAERPKPSAASSIAPPAVTDEMVKTFMNSRGIYFLANYDVANALAQVFRLLPVSATRPMTDRERGMMLAAISDFMAGITGLRPPAESEQIPPEVRPHIEALIQAIWKVANQ